MVDGCGAAVQAGAHAQVFNDLQLKFETFPKSVLGRDKCQGMT
jgi:hypothetical protein